MKMKDMNSQLTIGDLARRSDVKVSTLRVYERLGVLTASKRSASNYRLYDKEAVARLRFTRRAQELGFTLKEIKELLGLRANGKATCAEVCSFTEEKIADIEARIRSLRRMSRALAKLGEQCESECDSCACSLLDQLGADF